MYIRRYCSRLSSGISLYLRQKSETKHKIVVKEWALPRNYNTL